MGSIRHCPLFTGKWEVAEGPELLPSAHSAYLGISQGMALFQADTFPQQDPALLSASSPEAGGAKISKNFWNFSHQH